MTLRARRPDRARGSIRAAVATWAALAGGACTPRPATEVIVRIDSNIGADLRAVRVVLDRGDGTAVLDDREYPLGGLDAGFRLPGTIAFVPRDPGDRRALRARVTAEIDAARTFTTTVAVTLAPQRTLVLDVFLAAECEDASRRVCPAGMTCGVGGQCVPIDRPQQDYTADAARIDAPGPDAPGPDDTPLIDAADDDAPADVPTDEPPWPAPPRARAPLSTTRVTTARPPLAWRLPPGVPGVRVELCTDRACAAPTRQFDADGETATVPDPALPPGVWYWRLRGRAGTRVDTATSPWWQFTVGPHNATTASALGSAFDLDGDGETDVGMGAPRRYDSMMRVMIGHVTVRLGAALASAIEIGPPPSSHGGFGRAVANAGDVDGDGLGELAVGAPDAPGHLYVFRLGADGMSAALVDECSSPAGHAGYGGAVAGVGDVDGDGYGDIVVAEPGTSTTAGAIYLVRGGARGVLMCNAQTIPGPGTASTFGASVAAAGDIDNDGFADVIVGAPGVAGGGQARVYYGSAAGLDTTSPQILSVMSAGMFGVAVAGAVDVNGDGLADVAIGAPDTHPYASVFVYTARTAAMRLSTGTPPAQINDTQDVPSATLFGASVATAGDVTGDGLGDILVGAPATQVSAIQFGRVRLYAWPMGMGMAPSITTVTAMPALDTMGWGDAVALLDIARPGGTTHPRVVITNPRPGSGNLVFACLSNLSTPQCPAWLVSGRNGDEMGASFTQY